MSIASLQTINYMLESGDPSIITLNSLDKEYFSGCAAEFEFILDHYNKYNKIPDKVTFIEKFPDFELFEVNETSSYLTSALFEDYNKRNLAKTFNKIRELLNSDRVNEAMDVLNSAQSNISTGTSINSVDILHDVDSRYDQFVDKCSNFNDYFLTTGFKELDDYFGGFNRKEEYANIVARTNAGKSWVLLKCSIAAAEKGLNVGLYSGEMSELQVGFRADTLISHISNGSITHGNQSIANDYKKFIDSLKNNKIAGHLRVFTPAMTSGDVTVNTLRAFIEKYNLDALYIDQHSLLTDQRKGKTPNERAANISRDLKNLQVTKGIPIIAVSQLNRSSVELGTANAADVLATISSSDRISQDSTLVLALEQKDGILTISIAKARDCNVGKKFHYKMDFSKGTYTYIPSDGDMEEELKEEFELEDDFDGGFEFE